MEFSALFHALYRCYGDEEDMVPFFRTLFTNMTEIPEDEKPKETDRRKMGRASRKIADPVAELSDTQVKNWIKRKPAEKFLRQIIKRFDAVTLEEFFDEISEDGASLVVKEFGPVIPEINKLNFTQELTDYVTEAVYQLAKCKRPTASALAPVKKESDEWKGLYGDHLLAESENICCFPGCSRPLLVTDSNGGAQKVYEIAQIDTKKDAHINNLVALCPNCHARYSMNPDNADTKELKRIKALKASLLQMQQGLSADVLEKNLLHVIKRLANLKVSENAEIIYDPVHVREKIDAKTDRLLYQSVSRLVQDNFLDLHNILQDAHRNGDLDVEVLRLQVKTLYLKNKNKAPSEVFSAIVEKFAQTTKADRLYCQIVVAYFVQSCEIFEAQNVQGGVYAVAQ